MLSKIRQICKNFYSLIKFGEGAANHCGATGGSDARSGGCSDCITKNLALKHWEKIPNLEAGRLIFCHTPVHFISIQICAIYLKAYGVKA